jgi:hypothetical protein
VKVQVSLFFSRCASFFFAPSANQRTKIINDRWNCHRYFGGTKFAVTKDNLDFLAVGIDLACGNLGTDSFFLTNIARVAD